MIKILSTGSCLPKLQVTNDMFAEVIDTNDEWISSRTGIKVRNYADKETTTSMAIEAARIAVGRAGIDPQKISVVIAATFTADYATPHISSIVCSELNLAEEVTAFDLNAACSGFLYSLNTAKCLLEAQQGYALIIGSETISKVTDFTDRSSCVLFGDGAGAVVIELSPNTLYHYIAGRIAGTSEITCKGISNLPNPFVKREEESRGFISMNGKEVFRFATDKITKSVQEVLCRVDVAINEVDYFVCHQANYRILASAAKRLGAEQDKFFSNIDHCGNTSAASMPIALDEMAQQNLLKRGMKLVLTGFGAGLAYGAIYMEW